MGRCNFITCSVFCGDIVPIPTCEYVASEANNVGGNNNFFMLFKTY